MKNIFFLSLLIYSLNTFAQNSKKETINRYQDIQKIDTNEIKQGKHLNLAEEFAIEYFIPYYLENGKSSDTKKYGLLTITELFRDTIFTYYARTNLYGIFEFFKVKTFDLSKIDLNKINGPEIRSLFIEHIVPTKDKDRVKRNDKNCSTGTFRSTFKYQYNRATADIIITYHWKITCDWIHVLNKTYEAKYDLNEYKFKN